MTQTIQYAATLHWTGAGEQGTVDYQSYNRDYVVRVEGKPDIHGTANKMFRGDPSMHDPEDLLLAALSGCHMLTFLALCAKESLVVTSYKDFPSGTLELTREGGGRFLEIRLRPQVCYGGASGRYLHQRAHELCFIANSVSFPIRVEPV